MPTLGLAVLKADRDFKLYNRNPKYSLIKIAYFTLGKQGNPFLNYYLVRFLEKI